MTTPDTVAHVRITGRVQGVFYRSWTQREATALGLRGWVRNRADGSVEALFAGGTVAVEEMVARCGKGPFAASVSDVERLPLSDDVATELPAEFQQLSSL